MQRNQVLLILRTANFQGNSLLFQYSNLKLPSKHIWWCAGEYVLQKLLVGFFLHLPVWTFKGSSDKHAILKLYLCFLYQHCTVCFSLWFPLLCVRTLNTQTILSCVGLNTMSRKNKQFQPQQNSNYSCGASVFTRAIHSNYQRTYSDTVMIKTREKAEEIIN